MSRMSLTLALEGIDGKMFREIEYTFYAKIKDLADLEKASAKEEQEQWRLPLNAEKPVKARLRLINGRIYTMCTKMKQKGQIGCSEVEIDIGHDMYQMLKMTATDGYKKTRYIYPVPNTDRKWEVDVFLGMDGKPHVWVKIDFEVSSPDDELPSLPFEVEEIIVENGPEFDSSQERFVRSLWECEWSKLDEVGIVGKD